LAATLILAAGEPGNRVIIEYTILMIHKAYIPASVITPGMPRASVEEFEKEILASQIVVAELRRKNEVMVDMLSDLTGQLKEQLRADLANDKYMCPARLSGQVRARRHGAGAEAKTATGEAARDGARGGCHGRRHSGRSPGVNGTGHAGRAGRVVGA